MGIRTGSSILLGAFVNYALLAPLMIQQAAQLGALHQTLIALTVKFEEVSRVRPQDRVEMVRRPRASGA